VHKAVFLLCAAAIALPTQTLAVAVNFNGINGAGPPAATTGKASSVTDSSAILAASISAGGADTEAWFQCSTDSSMAGSLVTTRQNIGSAADPISYVTRISRLSANTTYYFQAWASNSSGTSNGSISTFTTAGFAAYTVFGKISLSPAFFLWGSYAVATRIDYSPAVRNGTFPDNATVPAKPVDIIVLWGTGFGPTAPTAPVGFVVPSGIAYNTADPVTVTVGGLAATVFGAALTPGDAGLYQIAIQIPVALADGDYPVVAKVSGIPSPSSVLLTVQREPRE